MRRVSYVGESIPIRLFLTPFELTPTYRNIHNKFSLKYYLNLVLVDEEDRRYFKQQVNIRFPFALSQICTPLVQAGRGRLHSPPVFIFEGNRPVAQGRQDENEGR
jgi:hypothetical protein